MIFSSPKAKFLSTNFMYSDDLSGPNRSIIFIRIAPLAFLISRVSKGLGSEIIDSVIFISSFLPFETLLFYFFSLEIVFSFLKQNFSFFYLHSSFIWLKLNLLPQPHLLFSFFSMPWSKRACIKSFCVRSILLATKSLYFSGGFPKHFDSF